MGNTGQGAGNGGGKGSTRVGATPATVTTSTPLQNMRTLAATDTPAADTALEKEINRIIFHEKITASDQDQGDTQKFFNATGLSKNKPQVVKDEDALQLEIARNNMSKDYPHYIFHGDSATSAAQGRAYADQLLGKRDQYIAAGRLGDGTYFSTSPKGSAGYMDHYGYGRQVKAMLNSNAKVISEHDLWSKMQAFGKTHPKAYRAIMGMEGSKKDYWDSSSKYSVFATLFGYNVVTDGSGKKTANHYLSVFDRSALTIVSQTKSMSQAQATSVSSGGWKFKNKNGRLKEH